MSATELNFEDIDQLLDMSMDDIDDLPPMGPPPTGHYNLTAKFERTTVGDDDRDVVACQFTIDAVNELKEGEDPDEAKIGQQFTVFFHPKKKDGSVNDFGIKKLKQMLAPFQELAGSKQLGVIIAAVDDIKITASVVRKQNRKNEDQYNVGLKDVVIL